MNCDIPNAMAKVPSRPNLKMGSAVFPFMQSPAKNALLKALDAHPGTTMTVNSMFRTVAQQYLLYRWYKLGKCGIGLAASPGFFEPRIWARHRREPIQHLEERAHR